jgi:hypothetical protein
MNQVDYNIAQSQIVATDTNKVLRSTYLLLSMTLLCSAVTAGISMLLNLSPSVGLVLLLVGFGLMFWVHKAANSANGIMAVFAFTACMGAALGPMLNNYLAFAGGPSLICADNEEGFFLHAWLSRYRVDPDAGRRSGRDIHQHACIRAGIVGRYRIVDVRANFV